MFFVSIFVPIFAPNITEMVWENCISPELTRPTSITVVADDDWITLVIKTPSIQPIIGFAVIFLRSDSSLPPANFSKFEDITSMPKRKKASPPISVITENKMFIISP